MTIYERFEEIKNTTELKLENAKDTYYQAELALANLVGDYVLGAEVACKAYSPGHIISYSGTTLDGLIVNIEFAEITKKFSLMHIMTVGNFINFVDTLEIGVIWNEAFTVHTELTEQFEDLKRMSKQLEREAAKKAEEEKRAEAKYQAAKTKALQEFQDYKETERPVSTTDEFYYSLGWLAKHIGSITAQLPDYLGPAFEQHFGAETPKTLIDSKAKSVGGFAKKWNWSFSCSIKKLKGATVPAYLQTITSDISKGIHNTSFIWDLVENYGFKFGKEQDIDKIRSCVPTAHIEFFENGLA